MECSFLRGEGGGGCPALGSSKMARERPAGMHLVPHALEWLVSMATKTVVSGRATSSLGHGLYPPPFLISFWLKPPHPHSQFSFRQGFASFRKQAFIIIFYLFFTHFILFEGCTVLNTIMQRYCCLCTFLALSLFVSVIIQPILLSDVNEYKGWGLDTSDEIIYSHFVAMPFWCRKDIVCIWRNVVSLLYMLMLKDSWCFLSLNEMIAKNVWRNDIWS